LEGECGGGGGGAPRAKGFAGLVGKAGFTCGMEVVRGLVGRRMGGLGGICRNLQLDFVVVDNC